jgi:hypothetical protein
MKFSALCEIISAAHLARYVTSPFPQRGGIFLVAPAGHLKTSAIDIIEEFERVLTISDLTVKSLTAMREDIIGGEIQTLAFSDYEKIYKRHASVSSNLEGIIMSLAEEGFRNPAYADQRVQATPARCLIVGAMTLKFYERMTEQWLDNGFMRRFLWCRFSLHSSEFLEESISNWKRAELDGDFLMKIPTNNSIPYSLTPEEVSKIKHSIRFQRDKKTPYILAQKIFCVLKWKFQRRDPELPMKIWLNFAEGLSKDGAILFAEKEKVAEVKPQKSHVKKH